MIYQLSLTFQKDREIYTPTKKKWMYVAVYCGSALYSVILKCVVEEIITVSIKSPPFIALHKKRKILKFWAGRGGKCPFSTPPDSAPGDHACLATATSLHQFKGINGSN